jgi:hypothetical protein
MDSCPSTLLTIQLHFFLGRQGTHLWDALIFRLTDAVDREVLVLLYFLLNGFRFRWNPSSRLNVFLP